MLSLVQILKTTLSSPGSRSDELLIWVQCRHTCYSRWPALCWPGPEAPPHWDSPSQPRSPGQSRRWSRGHKMRSPEQSNKTYWHTLLSSSPCIFPAAAVSSILLGHSRSQVCPPQPPPRLWQWPRHWRAPGDYHGSVRVRTQGELWLVSEDTWKALIGQWGHIESSDWHKDWLLTWSWLPSSSLVVTRPLTPLWTCWR